MKHINHTENTKQKRIRWISVLVFYSVFSFPVHSSKIPGNEWNRNTASSPLKTEENPDALRERKSFQKERSAAEDASSQQQKSRQLQIVVYDEENAPVIGATIGVKGHPSLGGFTDSKGKFSLKVPADIKEFTVTFLGMQQQTVTITSTQSVKVVLKSVDNILSEVVVTGFQNLDKRTFTGSTVKLSSDAIINQGITDVSRMLEGKAAGVSVQNVSGAFGAAPKIRIRGATSIYGENKPLWVIDGIVLEDIVNISNDQLSSGDPTTLLGSSVAGLNANDIDCIDILKDASATALYGARAMNGVIVVTTKKGKEGRPRINYSANFFIRQKPMYKDYNIMDSYSQMSIYAELERKGHITSSIVNNSRSGVYGKMYQLISNPDPLTQEYLVENSVAGRRAFLERYAETNTNWFDILFRNTIVSEHSMSLSSGTKQSQTYASLSFYDDPGWTIGESVKRYTGNMKNNFEINKRLNLDLNISANYREQINPGTLSRRSNSVTGEYDRDFDINPFSYAMNTSRALTAYDTKGNLEYFTYNFAPFNIINELYHNNLRIRIIDVKLQGGLNYKLNKDFTYSFIGAIRYAKTDREHMIDENSNMAMAYRADYNSTIADKNNFLYKDPDNPNAEPISVLPAGGFYNKVENQLRTYDIRNQMNYKGKLGERHELSAIGGIQVTGKNTQNFSNTGYGYQYEMGGIPFTDYKIMKMMLESNFDYYAMSENRNRFVAFYLNAEYTYDMRYAFSGTFRDEGSNELGKTARWLPTWNVGFRWNILEEKFMQGLTNIVDHMNIRTSYGLSASPPRGTQNSTTLYYNKNAYRPQGSNEAEPTIYISRVGNKGLTWEKSFQFNLGFNVSFLKNRISLTGEYWRKDNYDLIDVVKTAGTSGEINRYANSSDLSSNGYELTLAVYPVKMKDFSWRLELPFSYMTSKIKDMKYNPRIYDLTRPAGGNRVGYPLKSLFSVQFVGLDHDTGIPTFINESGKVAKGVYMQSKEIAYLKHEGQVDPKYTGGINNNVKYKDFNIGIYFTYQAGNKIRLYPAFHDFYSDLNAMPVEFKDRWIMPGDEAYTNIPSIFDLYVRNSSNSSYPYQTYNYSTVRVAKGDFLRLKTLSLTYNTSKSLLKKIGFVNQASLSLSANNLWLIYADKKLNGQDPEFYNSGGVAQPLQRQYILSLKLGF